MFISDGNITRTFFVCIATGFVVSGFDRANGTAKTRKVESEVFVSTKDNDKALAYRLLKSVDKGVIKDSVDIEVLGSDVFAQTNDDFISNGVVIERGVNGRVKK